MNVRLIVTLCIHSQHCTLPALTFGPSAVLNKRFKILLINGVISPCPFFSIANNKFKSCCIFTYCGKFISSILPSSSFISPFFDSFIPSFHKFPCMH